jgi:hypothetical protein
VQWLALLEKNVDVALLAARLTAMPNPALSQVMLELMNSSSKNLNLWFRACAAASAAPVEISVARKLLPDAVASSEGLECSLYGSGQSPGRRIENRMLVREYESTQGGRDASLRIRLSAFDDFYQVDPTQIAPELRQTFLQSLAEPDVEALQTLHVWLQDGRSNRQLKLQILATLVRIDGVDALQKLRAIL